MNIALTLEDVAKKSCRFDEDRRVVFTGSAYAVRSFRIRGSDSRCVQTRRACDIGRSLRGDVATLTAVGAVCSVVFVAGLVIAFVSGWALLVGFGGLLLFAAGCFAYCWTRTRRTR